MSMYVLHIWHNDGVVATTSYTLQQLLPTLSTSIIKPSVMNLPLAGTSGQTVPLPLQPFRCDRVAKPAGPRFVKLPAVRPQVCRTARIGTQSETIEPKPIMYPNDTGIMTFLNKNLLNLLRVAMLMAGTAWSASFVRCAEFIFVVSAGNRNVNQALQYEFYIDR